MQKNLSATYHHFLKHLYIAQLNPMQEEMIVETESRPNIMLLAPTGSGKTLAFLIPLINQLKPGVREVQALVVTPSRELALQIEDVFRSMKSNYKISCCYGGHSVKIEQNSLNEAPAVIIGTPGRIADHIQRGSFNGSTVNMVVLDEFDKSLQLGFQEQLKVIFKTVKSKNHLLTSATNLVAMPDFLPFSQPFVLNYLNTDVPGKLELQLVKANSFDKAETLLKLVSSFKQEVCLVFCNHRDAVERISAVFAKNNFEHGIFHGLLDQTDREKNLIKFRAGAHNVLIATDLASRGLDIPEIKHVVHYQLPPHLEEFTHRNGRTARMHAEGKAYLLLSEDESLPPYIEKSMKEFKLSNELILPPPPKYALLYISAGKKDKISKGDIAGLLMKKGGLQGDDLGLIATLDHASYVAVKRSLVSRLLAVIKDEKLKKTKVKIELAS